MSGTNPQTKKTELGAVEDRTACRLVAALGEAMVAADAEGSVILWNDAAAAMFGHRAEDVLGGSLDVIIPEAMRGEHAAGMRRIGQGGVPRLIGQPVEITAQRADKTLFPIEMRLSMWRENEALVFGAIIRDVSDRRRNEERLHGLAHFDQLTMLPNRILFFQRLHGALGDERDPRPLSIVLVDLDNFAEANDRLGHAAADGLLCAVAAALKGVALRIDGGDAGIARIGPNQFGFVLPGCADPMAVAGVADIIRQTLKGLGESEEVPVSASIGAAIAPVHGWTPAKLMANADFALRRAKHDGGDRAQIFLPTQREAHRVRRDLEVELKRAAENSEFSVYFQPQVRLSDGEIVGAEALLRWNHPERGVVLPGAFLDALSDHKLSEPVGDFVLETACGCAAGWRALTGRPMRVGVNLFDRQLLRRDMPYRVESALHAANLSADALELELIETTMTGSDETSIRRIQRLRDIGVGIAFDDYGTGYASLALLKRYPITRLKIDRGFVRDLAKDGEDAAIVDLVLTLGRRFGLEVIAEGVETKTQARRLKELGCVEAQGFLFGRPMPAEAFEALLIGRPGTARVA